MTSGSNEDLRLYLDEHVTFLKLSAAAFDAGFEGEAKRLAVSARVLLHDTANSRSLLGQIGMLSAPFYTTSVKWDKNNLAPHHGPLQLQFNNSGASYRAPLDDRSPHLLRWILFDEWWSDLIFDDRKWAAAGFTDTEFGCDDETGGEPWEREGYSAASTSLRL